MSQIIKRNIKRKWKVILQKNSDIHTAGLVLPSGNWLEFDPFLLMAEDVFQKGAFDLHPHRGIETVTYIIDGALTHIDNKGGGGILNKGDVQWMTAGSGIMHNEEPPQNVTVHLLQLWVNLPRAQKMTTPRYQDIKNSSAPVRKEEGATYRVFSGNSGSVISETKNHVPVIMVEITVQAGYIATQGLPSSYNGFLYILEGTGIFGNNLFEGSKGEVLMLDGITSKEGSSEISIKANDHLKLLFFAGEPLQEPVVAKGPFVMNTEDEIKQAYADFRSGQF